MSEKCYANFVCSECATMINDTFYYDTLKEAINHSITCPVCGRKGVQTSAPDSMKEIILTLLRKGYHVAVINEKTLCIIIKGRFESANLSNNIPSEFTLDRTEEMGDIIINERMKANDFDGVDKEEYISAALENLNKWAESLDNVDDNENRVVYYEIDETENKDETPNIAPGYAPYLPSLPFPIKNGYACKYTWEEINDMYNNLPNEEKEKYNTIEAYVDTLFEMEDTDD